MPSQAPAPVLPPADQRWFEDYAVDTVYNFGPIAVDRDELIAFAKAYDPQAMHTDEALAAAGPYGGLIASGWHTVGLLMRLYVDNFLSSVASLVSPGVDELRWTAPVRPGDQLAARVTVLETRRLRSDPMKGVIKVRMEGFNQDGAAVAGFVGATFMLCRAPEKTD
jgi:acyl dehydratase